MRAVAFNASFKEIGERPGTRTIAIWGASMSLSSRATAVGSTDASGSIRALLMAAGPERVALGGFFLVLTAMVMALPTAPFSIDNMLYIEMARAMAEQGTFSIAGEPGIVPADWLSISLTYGIGGQVYPQYPGGYALLSAPFYVLGGVRGLAMMNVLAACAILALTYRIALQLYADRMIARIAVALLAAASFLTVYAVGVWPHLVTLALLLAGVDRILVAAQPDQHRKLVQLCAAGLCCGLALNLRVDVMFPAAALLVWLRLFAMPSDRTAALAYLAGFAPGLILASSINMIKFGERSPLTYGPTDGTDSLSGYPVLLLLAAAGAIALFVVDASAPWVARCVRALRSRKGAIALSLSALAVIALIPPARQLAVNFYVLVFDLQQLDPLRWQTGVERGADGFIAFWGAYKKAFLQSLPWAALMIAPVWAFLRGEQAREHALALGVIAAPLVFYSLNQWHGGYSFSMRYFLPALPFVAILAGHGLRGALGADRTHWRWFVVGGAAMLAPGAVLVMQAAANPDAVAPQWHYYPAMILLAALAIVSIAVLARPQESRARLAQAGLAGGAVAVAVLVNLVDVQSFAQRKAFVATLNTHVADAVDEGALVLSVFDESLALARRQGVGAMNPKTQSGEVVAEAISAYRLAGRCVYAYMDGAFDAMHPISRADWRRSPIPGVNGELGALYQPVDQDPACDP